MRCWWWKKPRPRPSRCRKASKSWNAAPMTIPNSRFCAPSNHNNKKESIMGTGMLRTLTVAGALLLLGSAYAEDAVQVMPDAVKWRTYPLADGVQVSALYGGAE